MRKIILTFIVCALFTGLSLTSCCNTDKKADGNKTETVNDEKASANEKVASAKGYVCPMKCEGDKVYNEPGKCAECKMDLIATSELHEKHDKDHDYSEKHE